MPRMVLDSSCGEDAVPATALPQYQLRPVEPGEFLVFADGMDAGVPSDSVSDEEKAD